MTDDIARAKRIIGRLWRRRSMDREWLRIGVACVRRVTAERDQLRADLAAAERMNRAADEDRIRLHADLAEARAEVGRWRAATRTWLDRAMHGPRCNYWRGLSTDGLCDCGLDEADRELAALEVSDDG